jgi:hypothetical protein
MTRSIEIVLPKKFITALNAFVKTPTASSYSKLANTWKVRRIKYTWDPGEKKKWRITPAGYSSHVRLPVLMCQMYAIPFLGSCTGCPLHANRVGCLVYNLRHQSNLSHRALAAIELQAALKGIKYATVSEDFVRRCTGENRIGEERTYE